MRIARGRDIKDLEPEARDIVEEIARKHGGAEIDWLSIASAAEHEFDADLESEIDPGERNLWKAVIWELLRRSAQVAA